MQRMIEPEIDDEVLQKDIDDYLKQVSRSLTDMTDENREHYMRNFRSAVEDFAVMTPNVDIDQIIQYFGSPRKIHDAMLADKTQEKLRQLLHRYTAKRILLIVAVIIILVFGIGTVLKQVLYAAHGNPIVIVEKPTSYGNSLPTDFVCDDT